MNAYEVKNLIENLFEENGETVLYNFNDEDLDAPQEIKPILEKIEPTYSYQSEKEYFLQDIAEELLTGPATTGVFYNTDVERANLGKPLGEWP